MTTSCDGLFQLITSDVPVGKGGAEGTDPSRRSDVLLHPGRVTPQRGLGPGKHSSRTRLREKRRGHRNCLPTKCTACWPLGSLDRAGFSARMEGGIGDPRALPALHPTSEDSGVPEDSRGPPPSHLEPFCGDSGKPGPSSASPGARCPPSLPTSPSPQQPRLSLVTWGSRNSLGTIT